MRWACSPRWAGGLDSLKNHQPIGKRCFTRWTCGGCIAGKPAPTVAEITALPVGAGLPAKGPQQTPRLHGPDDTLRASRPATVASALRTRSAPNAAPGNPVASATTAGYRNRAGARSTRRHLAVHPPCSRAVPPRPSRCLPTGRWSTCCCIDSAGSALGTGGCARPPWDGPASNRPVRSTVRCWPIRSGVRASGAGRRSHRMWSPGSARPGAPAACWSAAGRCRHRAG